MQTFCEPIFPRVPVHAASVNNNAISVNFFIFIFPFVFTILSFLKESICFIANIRKKCKEKIFKLKLWRKGRDLNPRWSCPHNGFRGRRIQPLCHLSANVFPIIAQVGGKNQRIFYKIILTNVFFC